MIPLGIAVDACFPGSATVSSFLQERPDADQERNHRSRVPIRLPSRLAQDELALQTIREQGALPLIWDGQLQGAFPMLNRTLNSLPSGGHQSITEAEAEACFWQKLAESRQ